MALTIGRFDHTSSDAKNIIIGIDLGTTNSLVAISENGTPRILKDESGKTMTPSVIRWAEKATEPVIGEEAKKYRITDSAHTAYSVKRFMGRGRLDLNKEQLSSLDTTHSTEKNIVIRLGDKTFSATELSSQILKKLKNLAEKNLKTEISKAVVTVPAYFNDSQRAGTRLAGQLAGLDIVRIVNEPTAAALAYGLDRKKNGIIAVYDLGGGTFDISILKLHDGIFEVLATHGDTILGGDDFDLALTQIISRQIPNKNSFENDNEFKAFLIDSAESFKKRLSDSEQVKEELEFRGESFPVIVKRAEFENAISSLVKKTLAIVERAVADSHVDKSEINDVVMVGGSTRIPFVRELVKEYFKKDLNVSLNPDEVVALGAAVQAGILSGQNADMVLLDVVPLSLGIETYGGTVGKLVHRNTKIPTMAQETFTTHVDGQKNVLIHILQGERELANDCRSLARFNLSGLPAMPAGLPKIQVTFLIDANGILTVHAKEVATGLQSTVEVKPTYGLSDDEVEKMLTSGFDHAEEDMKARQLVDTRVEAEGIIKAAEKILKEADLASITENVKETKNQIKLIQKLSTESDYIAIREAIDKLEIIAKPIAEKVMNQALRDNLTNKKVTDVIIAKE